MFRFTSSGVSTTARNFPKPLAFTSRPTSTGSSVSALAYVAKLLRSVRSSAKGRMGNGTRSRSPSSAASWRAMTHTSSKRPKVSTVSANRRPIPLEAPVITAIRFMLPAPFR